MSSPTRSSRCGAASSTTRPRTPSSVTARTWSWSGSRRRPTRTTARIAAAWDLWPTAGTQGALELTPRSSGSRARSTDRPIGRPTPPRAGWSQWWFYCTGHTFGSDGAWDDAGTWGDGGVWDLDASLDDIGASGAWCASGSTRGDRGHIVFVFDTDWWGPETPWDNGQLDRRHRAERTPGDLTCRRR